MPPANANNPFRTADPDPSAAMPGTDLTAEIPQGSSSGDGSKTAQVPGQATEPRVAPPETGTLMTMGNLTPAAPPTLADRTGVPGYELLGELGRGGMGVVYKARHLTLKRIVALKMVLAGGHAGPRELARFRIEAEAVARLQHPNIVQIHEVGAADGHPYCALEFVEGGNLASKLDGKPMPAREAARLVEALARAMQLAHSRNVVHRDLKPANILLAADGTPKITDFGLARQMDSDSGETQAGAVMGTPSYMAPEQASGHAHEAGPAADVYALGAILYDCLAGRPPFKGKTVVETLDQVRTQEPMPPARWQASVPLDLNTICLKCLRKEPEKRYASAAELADELARYLRGEPILARPVGLLERTWKWAKRNPAWTAGIAAGLLLLAFATVTGMVIREQGIEKQKETHAAGLVQAVLNANTAQVPAIVGEIAEYRKWADPLLRDEYDKAAATSRQKLHASLALLPADPGQVDYLCGRLLDAEPHEVPVIRDALAPHKDALLDKLWVVVLTPDKGKEPQRLRAAAALAKYDPEGEKWTQANALVADDLVLENAVFLGQWSEAFRPIRGRLLSPLSVIFRDQDPERSAERNLATNLLADYAAGQPQVLADLLMDADKKQFAVIYPKFKEQGERGLPMLSGEIGRKLPPDARDDVKETLAKRQANAAVALLKMDRPAKVWPLLEHSPDPRVRTYLIHRFGPLGAEARAIVKRLDEEPDVTIQRALLLSLGAFGEKELSREDRNQLLPKLQEMYRTALDPGLHGSVEWLLRQWQEEAWLKQISEEWAKGKEQREKRLEGIKQTLAREKEKAPPQWYVNGQGQTMVVIPGPVEFVMGSPPAEAGRFEDERQHKKRIGRTFALAAKPVTVEQYRQFDRGYALEAKYTRTAELPVVGIDWYMAAKYCNWLSNAEGIPEEQWSYEIKGNEVKLKENYLSLTGYRLPTEAEMEYATRAGALTARYYGETEELLPKYAWFNINSQDKPWPVGSLKPNDFGLFDMQGNVYCWCQETSTADSTGKGEKAAEDREDELVIVSTRSRVLRVGSYRNPGSIVRSANIFYNVPTDRRYDAGFRPARTVAP